MARVLLVEPDRVLARIYYQVFVAAGNEVQVRPSAQAAIHCADDVTPDVVVLELQLVAHSGIEFLYEFRSYTDWQDVPIIVNTAVPAGEFAHSWGLLRDQLKVVAYHYKPHTSLQALLRSIQAVTEKAVLV